MGTVMLALAVLWVVCSMVTYGYVLNVFVRKYPLLLFSHWGKNRRFALRMSIFGPIGLGASLPLLLCGARGRGRLRWSLIVRDRYWVWRKAFRYYYPVGTLRWGRNQSGPIRLADLEPDILLYRARRYKGGQ